MGEISTLGRAAFRDYVTDGVPSSGANEPFKPAIRTFVDKVDELVAEVTAIAFTDSVAKDAVNAATTAALPACTYANGTAGVGATLTGNANGALAAQDGVTLTVNQRLLVKNQASALQNWIYTLTQVGTGGTPFILTRATDSNTPAQIAGAYVFVLAGTTLIGTSWAAKLPVASITIGTTDLTPAQINGPGGVATEAVARAAADALMWLGKWPFLPVVTDDYMRSIVKDIWIEGGDAGHAYVLNYETLDLGSGNGRVRFKIYDATLGIHVCTWIVLDTQANITARSSPTGLLYQADLAGYTGITATIWVNWAAVTDWSKTLTTYTSPNNGGIRTDRIITPGEIRERFKRGAEPKIRLTVGTGTPTATHFNSVLAAVQSLYIPGWTVTRSGPFPLSDICTFSNQALVEVIDDGYDETITLVTIDGLGQSPLVLPPFITLRGLSNTDTRIKASHATNSGPVIEAPFPFRIEQMRVENLGAGGGYAVHIDNQNDRAKRSTAAGDRVVLRYPMVSVLVKATFLSTSASTWVIGCGISNGQTIRLERCRVYVPASRAGLGIHNNPSTGPATTDPGEIEVIDTYFSDAGADAISLVKGIAMTVQHRVLVQGSDLDEIVVGNTVGGAAGFIREGKIDAGITITGTLDT